MIPTTERTTGRTDRVRQFIRTELEVDLPLVKQAAGTGLKSLAGVFSGAVEVGRSGGKAVFYAVDYARHYPGKAARRTLQVAVPLVVAVGETFCAPPPVSPLPPTTEKPPTTATIVFPTLTPTFTPFPTPKVTPFPTVTVKPPDTPTLAPPPSPTPAETPKATPTPVDFWKDKAWQAKLVSTDMAVKEQAINEWLKKVSLIGFTPQEEERLRQVLGYLKYVPNNHDVSILPWVHAPYPRDSLWQNPLRYLKNIRFIDKGTVTRQAPGGGMELNLDERSNTKYNFSREAQELLLAASVMKEGSGNTWLQEDPRSFLINDGAGNRTDLATVEAELFTTQALIDARKPDGSFLLSDKVRSELKRFMSGRIDQMNQAATEKGWW